MNKKTLIVMAATVAIVAGASGGIAWKMGLIGATADGKPQNAQTGNNSQKGKKDKDLVLTFTAKELSKVTPGPRGQRLEFSGSLVASQNAVVRSKGNGTLLRLNVREGDTVKAGQSLGLIDSSEASIRVAERGSNVAGAESAVANAQRLHDANRSLADKGFISAAALEGYRHQLDAAKAQLAAARSQQQGAQLALKETALTAPISGVISKRHAVAGEKLSQEQAILTIIQTDALDFIGQLAPHQISLVSLGALVEIQLDGVAQFINGQITRIGPAAEPSSKAIPIVVRVSSPSAQGSNLPLQPGQFGQAKVVSTQSTSSADSTVLWVPATAVVSENSQSIVWVVNADTLDRRTIQLGERSNDGRTVEVVSGLKAGETILGMRFDGLKNGQKVKIEGAR